MSEIKASFELFHNISLTIDFMHTSDKTKEWNEHKTNTHYTLWLVTKGNVLVDINENTFAAHPYDVILFYPGESYHAYTDCETCQFIFIFFQLGMGNMIDGLYDKNASGLYTGVHLHKQSMIFQKNYLKRQKTAHKYMLSSLADLIQLLSFLFTEAVFSPFEKKKKTSDSQVIIDSLLYINDHYMEDIKIKDLAKKYGLSEKYFISMFHYNAAISPKQYQIECRMKKAATMLINSNCTIKEISYVVGYPDQYSFSKAFRKYFGESPDSFRKS